MEEQKQEKSGRTKRILKRILLGILLVILFFALVGLWTWKNQSDYESTAVPYLQSVVPQLTTWDPDVVWDHLAEEARSQTNRADNAKIVRYLSGLGALENLGYPQFRQITSTASVREGMRKVIVYQIPAVFEAGEASIDVTILDKDGQFSIYGFKVNTMAFAERQSEGAEAVPAEDAAQE